MGAPILTGRKAVTLPGKGEKITAADLIALAELRYKPDVASALRVRAPGPYFASDGCTLFPDRIASADLYEACFWHDVRYWMGRPSDDLGRLHADLELARDVGEIAGPEVARAMFFGVTVGGSHKLGASWRWGYGWGRK